MRQSLKTLQVVSYDKSKLGSSLLHIVKKTSYRQKCSTTHIECGIDPPLMLNFFRCAPVLTPTL